MLNRNSVVKKFINSPELLTNFCLRELARRWGPAKVGRPANKPLRVEATSDPSSSFESFSDSLVPLVPGPSTFSAEFTTEPTTRPYFPTGWVVYRWCAISDYNYPRLLRVNSNRVAYRRYTRLISLWWKKKNWYPLSERTEQTESVDLRATIHHHHIFNLRNCACVRGPFVLHHVRNSYVFAFFLYNTRARPTQFLLTFLLSYVRALPMDKLNLVFLRLCITFLESYAAHRR